ncbi:putative transferase CAF17 homolog, mitochondrial [Liolophura sinensis]|uniref:putative transferase CAF17 homolog, mitochondrial n=1 Tax=Liolophura sinensis TaxID=3198878 RepID=UPI003158B59E
MAMTLGIPRVFLSRYRLTRLCGAYIQLRRQLCMKHTTKNIPPGLQQVLLYPRNTNHVLTRRFNSAVACSVHKLLSRGAFKVEGKDSSDFLQGLITSNMKWVEVPRSAMYAMMLNAQGRVMYDLLVYNISASSDRPCFLIECDRTATDSLIKDIKKYKLRKKIDIVNMTDSVCLSAVLPPDTPESLQELSVPDSDCLIFAQDPRVKDFGWRLITTADNSNMDSVSKLGVSSPEQDYHIRRYRWGISEGCIDLPPGNCFPLESNLVYLNGACFQKGCYIGQELTARTYHTGVTRKRLMPLIFEKLPENISPGTDIKTEDNKQAGKYRHSVGHYGLGLMRLAEIDKQLVIKNEDNQAFPVSTVRPRWWPDEAEDAQGLKLT